VTVRFLADEDLDSDIVRGLLAREPAVDVLDIKNAGLRGTKDPALLDLADEQDRIVITNDRRTMTHHFGAVEPRDFYSSSEKRNRRDYRVTSSRVDRVEAGRVTQSDRLPAAAVKTKTFSNLQFRPRSQIIENMRPG
jgi:hypothetical protein